MWSEHENQTNFCLVRSLGRRILGPPEAEIVYSTATLHWNHFGVLKMGYTVWDDIQRRFPDASKPSTWEEDFKYRVDTGGCDRAATMFANGLHPEDQRELPPWDAMTGVAPPPQS